MKKIVLTAMALCLACVGFAQEVDSAGSTMSQPVRKPLELSWEQTEVGDFSAQVPYVYQRNADVMYYHTIWRVIDLREKMNHPLYFPLETRGTWRSLAQVIFDAVDLEHPERTEADGILPLYTDEFCTNYVSRDGVKSSLSKTKSITLYDEYGEEIGTQELTESFTAQMVSMYRVKELWFIDKRRSVLEVRILEIEPIIEYEKDLGEQGPPIPGQVEEEDDNDVKAIKLKQRLGFIMYDELRPFLVKQEVYNPKNNAQRLSLDDLLTWKREFSSYIYQEQNVYNDRQISDYIANARDQRIESDRITEKIRTIEHDLWEF